jgi:hypothetical protein
MYVPEIHLAVQRVAVIAEAPEKLQVLIERTNFLSGLVKEAW